MKIKITILLTLLLTITAVDSYSQRWMRDRDHIVLGLGGSGFMGDLGGADDPVNLNIRHVNLQATQPTVMLAYRYYLLEDIAVRGNMIYGQLSGDDNHTKEEYRNNRNIHFRSPIIELSAQGEFYFFSAERAGARYRRLTRGSGWVGYNISAYAFLGFGAFYFNPQGHFDKDHYASLNHASISYDQLPDNGWYDLRPLRTEGQGILPTRQTYSQYQVSVPLGIGALFQISRELAVGLEFGFRKTWTDYIDDVSTTYVDPTIFRDQWQDDPQKVALAEYFSNPTNNTLGDNITAPGQQRGGPAYNDFYMFSFITVFYKFPDLRPTHGLPRF